MSTEAPEFTAPIAAPDAEGMFTTPDHTKSRNIPPGIKKAMGKLGNNKKARGGPRQLKPEDVQRLEDYYDMFAMAMQLYKPAVAMAIRDDVKVDEDDDGVAILAPRARVCAEAWGDLAKENDSVRRFVLMLVETGAWSKVFMVNLPILVAALPDDALSRVMARFMPNPTVDDTVVDWREAN